MYSFRLASTSFESQLFLGMTPIKPADTAKEIPVCVETFWKDLSCSRLLLIGDHPRWDRNSLAWVASYSSIALYVMLKPVLSLIHHASVSVLLDR